MEYLHPECFKNHLCPQVDHPLVKTLPINDLGPELSSRLEASLKVSEGVDCAKSARLWESLLEVYRIPYLLLRVADMRMTLKSRPTALTLYEELQTILNDPQLGFWIGKIRAFSMNFDTEQLEEYKIGIPAFAVSQCWQSTIETPFPHCKLQQMQIKELRDEWSSMGDPHILMDKFLNMHALATNKIEGNFDLNYSDTTRLIQVGFYHQMESTSLKHIITSTAMDRAEILSILRDTHETLRDVFELLKSEHIHLTVIGICKLHKTLMQTNRVRYFPEAPVGLKYIYLNIGVTRQVSRLNVTAPLNATAAFGEKGTAVQFCPYDEVELELNAFCHHVNELLQANIDPFAAAAWISHVFVSIHPFEDGNGRLSRILASIPLLKAGLPPLCIIHEHRETYIQSLNSIRANRDGDFRPLMEELYDATRSSITALHATISKKERFR